MMLRALFPLLALAAGSSVAADLHPTELSTGRGSAGLQVRGAILALVVLVLL
jgi:hypothetical protein